MTKNRTACQDHQAEESIVKCLSRGHNRMARVDFELRLCRSQSRRSQPPPRCRRQSHDLDRTIKKHLLCYS